MAKKIKPSIPNNSQPWKKSLVFLACDTCGMECRVGDDIIKVICWKCVNKLVGAPEFMLPDPYPDMPKGWRSRKQYVYSNGTVYEFGIEKPELFGTIQPKKPKVIKEKKKKVKLTASEKTVLRTNLVKELNYLKDEQKRAVNTKDSKRVQKKIQQISKQILKLK